MQRGQRGRGQVRGARAQRRVPEPVEGPGDVEGGEVPVLPGEVEHAERDVGLRSGGRNEPAARRQVAGPGRDGGERSAGRGGQGHLDRHQALGAEAGDVRQAQFDDQPEGPEHGRVLPEHRRHPVEVRRRNHPGARVRRGGKLRGGRRAELGVAQLPVDEEAVPRVGRRVAVDTFDRVPVLDAPVHLRRRVGAGGPVGVHRHGGGEHPRPQPGADLLAVQPSGLVDLGGAADGLRGAHGEGGAGEQRGPVRHGRRGEHGVIGEAVEAGDDQQPEHGLALS